MRCCGNCEWSISSLDEKDIIIDENESNIPNVGDCALSIDHNGRYICDEHTYISDGIKNYILHDNFYFGEGYFIISEYNGQIVKFIKFYKISDGFPAYAIRAYETTFDDNKSLNHLRIELNRDNTLDINLLKIFMDFASSIGNNVIRDYDSFDIGKSTLSMISSEDSVIIDLYKNDSEDNSRYINLFLGDFYTSDYYYEISLLFRDLAWIYGNELNRNKTIKMLKKCKCLTERK